ncbi:peroxiredoxin-like family protein [Hufsiella ginkgonis]|uniref:thioredoxin-dependent peroxiredoxin n=1 Tax=Hufsiella ginkgonis TaxID=2695274 RepID=A0A7K1XXY2_9SPHI|nr:peroxiredoxin-like family protein [Hufsiella ginkgonis]MXV15803.1 redoxin domain-containing protein [Hufsiella ginkgonis]
MTIKLINQLVVKLSEIIFIVFIFAFSSTTSLKAGILPADTIKMTAGVPLKPQDISPLLIGESIPKLVLPKSSGEPFDLNLAVAAKPTILVFYRGGWCPFCNKQLAGLQAIEADLKQMGFQVIAISTDSPENLSQTMTRNKLSYTLLSDADLSAAKKFGIAFKGPKNYDSFLPAASGGKNTDKLLPVPSVFILNKKGNIRFEYINPDITQRLSASLLKAAATSLHDEL